MCQRLHCCHRDSVKWWQKHQNGRMTGDVEFSGVNAQWGRLFRGTPDSQHDVFSGIKFLFSRCASGRLLSPSSWTTARYVSFSGVLLHNYSQFSAPSCCRTSETPSPHHNPACSAAHRQRNTSSAQLWFVEAFYLFSCWEPTRPLKQANVHKSEAPF